MSLISPHAWGAPHDEASWRTSILQECSQVYADRLAHGRVTLPEGQRESLARAVCSEPRVFWSFVHVARPEAADVIEADLRGRDESEDGPMVIGVRGRNALETTTALHALRELLFYRSNTLLEWTRDRRIVNKWSNDPDGGAWGGLVYVNIENRAQLKDKSERVRAAYGHMATHQMSTSLLAVSAVGESQPELNGLRVRWADLTASEEACSHSL